MVDMAHFAGLVAGKVFTGDYDPVPHAHIVTTTTHKTLRGPRGGLVLCSGEFAEAVDKGCPLVLGGPLPHVMAAKAVALQRGVAAGVPRLRGRGSSTTPGRSPRACIGAGVQVAHRRHRQPPACSSTSRRRSGSPAGRPRRRCARAGITLTATRCPSTPTAPGTPAACGSARRRSPRWAWAPDEMRRDRRRRCRGAARDHADAVNGKPGKAKYETEAKAVQEAAGPDRGAARQVPRLPGDRPVARRG